MTPFQKLVGYTVIPAAIGALALWCYLMWRDQQDTHNLKVMNYKMSEFTYDKMKVSDMEIR